MGGFESSSGTVGKHTNCSRVPTDVHVFPGLPHGFRVHATLSECKRWDSVMAHGVQWALSKPVATGVFEIKTK